MNLIEFITRAKEELEQFQNDFVHIVERNPQYKKEMTLWQWGELFTAYLALGKELK